MWQKGRRVAEVRCVGQASYTRLLDHEIGLLWRRFRPLRPSIPANVHDQTVTAPFHTDATIRPSRPRQTPPSASSSRRGSFTVSVLAVRTAVERHDQRVPRRNHARKTSAVPPRSSRVEQRVLPGVPIPDARAAARWPLCNRRKARGSNANPFATVSTPLRGSWVPADRTSGPPRPLAAGCPGRGAPPHPRLRRP